jgi:uncharacterized protein (TIGR00251 family)
MSGADEDRRGPALADVPGGVRLRVRVQPRARDSAVVGWAGGALKVRLSAPPLDGRANEALLDILAAALGLRRRDLRLVSGPTAREKVVEVAGLSAAEAARRLGP